MIPIVLVFGQAIMHSKVGSANDPGGKILRFLGAADLTTARGRGEKGVFSLLNKQAGCKGSQIRA